MTTTTAQQSTPSGIHAGVSTVGMVGAGQLARMTHQAAISLGINLKVLATDTAEPAVTAGAAYVLGTPHNLNDLKRLAEDVQVVTFDHELIPPDHLTALHRNGVVLAPGPAALACGQDKLHARQILASHGLPLIPYTVAHDGADVLTFAGSYGWPLIAKARRGGYDGKGVWRLKNANSASKLLAQHAGELLIEPELPFDRELAVLVARTTDGRSCTYPVVETIQVNAVCREVLAPAPIPSAVADNARAMARRIADAIDAVGILAVEFFLVSDQLVVNELALRPHNSGHYSIEGTTTSQFEQHLRAILGWPLGASDLTAAAVATLNVLGPADGRDPRSRLPHALNVPGAHVHLYAKKPRPGRKLGHVTVCAADLDTARTKARRAVALLEGRAA